MSSNKLKNRRPMKLYTRIALFFVTAFSVLLVLSFTMVYFFSQQIIFNENQNNLIKFNRYIINVINDNKDTLMTLPASERLDFIAEKIAPNTKDNTLISYRIADNLGTVNRSAASVDKIMDPENISSNNIHLFKLQLSFANTDTEDFEVDSFRYDGHDYYYLGSTYILAPDYILYIQTAKNLNDSLIFMNILLGIQIAISIVCLVIILFLGIYGTKSSLKPLIEISETAKNITENNLNTRIPQTGNRDELDQLILSLNQMIGQLEQAFETQKRFVSDASHELRIPLTIIQGYTDILTDWGQNDPALIAEASNAIRSETADMKKLVEELLLLSRLENNYFTEHHETLSLNELLQKALHDCRLIDEIHQYRLDLKDHCTILCNPGLIQQALRAVIDNSIKYTPPNGRITLSCWTKDSYAVMAVSDTGYGIPKEDLPKIRQRFYRVNRDRSRETGGTGLGLSIIDSIITLHHGKLEIDSTLGVGTTVKMLFPYKKTHG